MRYILLIVLLLASQLSYAKEKRKPDRVILTTEIHCFRLDTLLDQLRLNYGEEPMMMGKSDIDQDAVTMLFVNQESGSYTIVGLGKSIGCIYDTGKNVRYRMPKFLDNKLM